MPQNYSLMGAAQCPFGKKPKTDLETDNIWIYDIWQLPSFTKAHRLLPRIHGQMPARTWRHGGIVRVVQWTYSVDISWGFVGVSGPSRPNS